MIRLVLPTEDYEEQVLDYKASFERDGDSLDVIAGLLNFRTFKEWYEALLDNFCEAGVLKKHGYEGSRQQDRAPGGCGQAVL